MIKNTVIFSFHLVCLLSVSVIRAQDPSFSQFFSSPLNVNPALTGNIHSDWRVISNFRHQQLASTAPYITGSVCLEKKWNANNDNSIREANRFGIGVMMMYDKVMNGALKSNYASANLSYTILVNDMDRKHEISFGVAGIYGNRRINQQALYFEEQFSGNEFHSNLPTGETGLYNMKPYLSASIGLVYHIYSDISSLDFGVSGFHINRPRQTFIKDENQFLPRRYVAHANYEHFLNDEWVLNCNSIFQEQGKTNYFSLGGGLAYFIPSSKDMFLMGGLWYWSNKALIPYFSAGYGNFQFGCSYDIASARITGASIRQNIIEFSVIFRGSRPNGFFVPCPWK
jgi:type IX secretion system PorP/SprF family membrane protein